MRVEADRYTRLVSWLKVLFPLAALALLSTLFLLSRTLDPDAAIPFADTEVQERLRDQQITGPFFSGTTANGDMISFSAEKLTTPPDGSGGNVAQAVRAEISLATGADIELDAQRATFDVVGDLATLEGGVVVTTSTGYEITTDRIEARLSELGVTSPDAVSATGPIGEITAGQMTLSAGENEGSAQLVFTNRVKLIYTPQPVKE